MSNTPKKYDIWNLGGTSTPLSTFYANHYAGSPAAPSLSAGTTNSYKYVPNMTPPPSNPGTGWVDATPVDPSKALIPISQTKAKTGARPKSGAKSGGLFNGLFAPELGANLKGTFGKFANPQFNWTKGGGLQGWGRNLGGLATGLNAGMDALSAAQGITDISEVNDTSEDIMSDIIAAAANSPTIQYDLNANQLKMLRDVQRGTYDVGGGLSDVNFLSALTGALPDALMGLMYGGIPGAVIGGLGNAVNSGIGDVLGASQQNNAELEALYQAVLESEQQHKNARKQRAYESLIY